MEKSKISVWLKKLLLCTLGYGIMSTGITVTLRTNFGVDPLSVLEEGLAQRLHTSFGNAAILVMVVMLAASALVDRRGIGFGTLYSVAVLGPFVTVAQTLLRDVPPPTTLPTRILTLLLGFLMLCVGSALVVGIRFGYHVRDIILFYLEERLGIPYRWWRIGIDCLCVLAGYLLGGPIGVGTILCALGSGPLITVFVDRYDRWILQPLGLGDPRNRMTRGGRPGAGWAEE
ncbi:MAG: hypothetical protein HFF07_07285 [Oscillospiraceae bacterium]|nr:hypothetical protein [Oscillospiraceae bacterium]